MRIAVTGNHGQVVTALRERAGDNEIISLGRPHLDLADHRSVGAAITASRPDIVVSAAAYTAVDKAESDADLAFAINRDGAGAVASVAARLGLPVVHLSTDYVFDGAKPSPYVETDATGPTGIYGASKLAGEDAVAHANPDYAILRTAWVYSPFGNNFVKTMLRLAGDRDLVSVVDDQRGNPTSAFDIADAILGVCANLLASKDPGLRGVFHMTGSGEASWADFAEAIFAESERRGGPFAQVRRIGTKDYPTPAKRPANSRLDCGKLAAVHNVRLPDWHLSLSQTVGMLIGT
ncbi:MAG TPA: dTDP-4-dehydrorhamnose reductase [Devosia sp.]|nr:dTDP-4-dehydrorhamnose reductase [Devosia sp.]